MSRGSPISGGGFSAFIFGIVVRRGRSGRSGRGRVGSAGRRRIARRTRPRRLIRKRKRPCPCPRRWCRFRSRRIAGLILLRHSRRGNPGRSRGCLRRISRSTRQAAESFARERELLRRNRCSWWCLLYRAGLFFGSHARSGCQRWRRRRVLCVHARGTDPNCSQHRVYQAQV